MSEEEKEFYGDEEHFLLEYDDEIEELKADIEEYRDSTTWWSNRFNAVERNNRELRQEIERLHSIIKEVREYIENNTLYEQDYTYDYEENIEEWPPDDTKARKDILSILEKENK